MKYAAGSPAPYTLGSYSFLGSLGNRLVSAISDINGDGVPDLLIQDPITGSLSLSTMTYNGGHYYETASQAIANPGPQWRCVSAPMLTSGAVPSLLWQNIDTGEVWIWGMNYDVQDGYVFYNANYVATLPPHWRVAAAKDINGDGIPDLILENTDGRVFDWIMSTVDFGGLKFVSPGYITTLSPDWTIGGVSDINRDGVPDLIWQNRKTGEIYWWPMTYANGQYTSPGYYRIGNLPTVWTLEGID